MKIAKVLGTDELFIYLEKYDIELDSQYDDILGRYVIAYIYFLRYVLIVASAIRRSHGHASLLLKTSVTYQTKQ